MLRTVGQSVRAFCKKNRKTLCILFGLIVFVTLAQRFGLDKKVIVIIVLFFGYVTQVFTVLVGLVAAIPIIGPPVAHIISLPFFLIVNGLAYIVTLFTLRKGYTKDVLGSRVLVTAFLIGIIIGFALGKLL